MKIPELLFLEDEPQLSKIVTETLQGRGFSVTQLSNGEQGLEALATSSFDLCIVDVMMPFMDGFSFVKALRASGSNMPVLFLTARSQDKDVAEGYQSGGNDYLRKPFSLEELIFRINELLKRSPQTQMRTSQPLNIGGFQFFAERQELVYQNVSIRLSHKEAELLAMLLQHKYQLLDRKTALLKLWGDDSPFNARTMDVFISKLRKHLQADPGIEIINVRGLGYKLVD